MEVDLTAQIEEMMIKWNHCGNVVKAMWREYTSFVICLNRIMYECNRGPHSNFLVSERKYFVYEVDGIVTEGFIEGPSTYTYICKRGRQ